MTVPVVVLPLDSGARASRLLDYLLKGGPVVERDEAGLPVLQPAADGWRLNQLMTFDADTAELAEGDAGANDVDPDGSPALSLEVARLQRAMQPLLFPYCSRISLGREAVRCAAAAVSA